ncbi:hypothetical protein [Pseudodesulfovibrio sp.]|uniref:hypothetical protein n=1 Tax=Pseudodesulfovibrio sp. TaxID=2035812 RepID=UPI00260F99E8|nr:hypothetical protein [Pseudodesulfovibrio sp.]MDD3312953.1 hypothetical protein [Pseudodesulfovibrio sp.]
MIANKKEFGTGLGMLAVFFVVLVVMFQPIFHGHNGMQFLDHLYNSISKGSVDYAPAMKAEAAKLDDRTVTLNMQYKDENVAAQSAVMLTAAGSKVDVSGAALTVTGSLGAMLGACLDDSKTLYDNDAASLKTKYGVEGRRALYNWWMTLNQMDNSLKKQKAFDAAKTVLSVQKKAVEAAYNYYGIDAEHISERMGLVSFSLIFYVLYTLWYGFAILFLFEGWGLRLSH